MSRLCPLCDRDWEPSTCPIHNVPTIGPTHGPTVRLDVGVTLVNRFRIEGLLGQGGMGALLSATDLQDGTHVVVKVLRGGRVKEIANIRRFYQEARAVRALDHPNIVEILMFGIDEQTRAPFLAMEFVQGRTLKAWVKEEGPFGELTTATLFMSIASALAAAHRANVVHRDLKPSNIMVMRTETGYDVKVLDFGLAKILEDRGTTPLTMPGKTVGTPAFMSPEQVTQRPQDFRTDLYGLGCMLHATLTGSPPFTGSDLVDVMRRQMKEPAPPLPAVLSDGQAPSLALRALHAQLLAKDPGQRPQSTEAVVQACLDLKIPPTSAMLRMRRSQFEHQDTQVDVPAPSPPLLDLKDIKLSPPPQFGCSVVTSGEEPTIAHDAEDSGASATALVPKVSSTDEQSTQREIESSPSLTSIIPATFRADGTFDSVPASPPTNPVPEPAELFSRGMAHRKAVRVHSDSSATMLQDARPFWLAIGLLVASLILFVSVASMLRPAPVEAPARFEQKSEP
ncbi:MAG: serine/threonine-protein kinase [Myxococcota bacterium]